MVAIKISPLKNPLLAEVNGHDLEDEDVHMPIVHIATSSLKMNILKIVVSVVLTILLVLLIDHGYNKVFLQTTPSQDFAQVQIYNGKETTKMWKAPPPHEQLYKFARYVTHIAEFGSLSTVSTADGIKGFPFANVFSMSDGPYDNSTGVPYFYLTPIELSSKDLRANDKCSLTLSLAQSDYCSRHKMDPQDPRCAHIIFTGTMVKLQEGSEEEKFGHNALFSRHWEMATWPKNHDWFVAKLDITHIILLDYFGGAEHLDIKKYFEESF